MLRLLAYVSLPIAFSAQVAVTTLHWNSHRPCATENATCISMAQRRLGEMAEEVGASIVGAVELKDAGTALPGWQSSGEQCDHSAVMVAPGWKITKSGGFCINNDTTKGFAVALVTPPEVIAGCPALCVIMAHVPHGDGVNLTGHDVIDNVCGAAATSCLIGMADWNALDISSRWKSLIGGSPSLVDPQVKPTCCHPLYILPFDHVATNILGAKSAGNKVFSEQLKFPENENEHHATSVQLQLPASSYILA